MLRAVQSECRLSLRSFDSLLRVAAQHRDGAAALVVWRLCALQWPAAAVTRVALCVPSLDAMETLLRAARLWAPTARGALQLHEWRWRADSAADVAALEQLVAALSELYPSTAVELRKLAATSMLIAGSSGKPLERGESVASVAARRLCLEMNA